MGTTKIQWTATEHNGIIHDGFSFNTHWGCTEQGAPGHSECDNCYARVLANRFYGDIWGHDKPRRFQSESYWKQPFNWDSRAAKLGSKLKVFANSMSDWAEGRTDLDGVRERLFGVIGQTPNLNWLLLTKLPNRITERGPLPNVWYGTSVGVDKSRWRIDKLRKVGTVPVRFLSIEPLLEPLPDLDLENISWIVVGGESVGGRQCKLEWIEDVIAQAQKHGIPVFVKQLGTSLAKQLALKDKQGGDIDEFPAHLRIREFPLIHP